MLKKFALLAVALTLAIPAFADTPSKSPTSKTTTGSTKPAKGPKNRAFKDGTEAHGLNYKLQSPYDANANKLSGKRRHTPAPPAPPANGSLSKKIPAGFDTQENAAPK